VRGRTQSLVHCCCSVNAVSAALAGLKKGGGGGGGGESVVSRLLQLGGNAVLLVLLCVSPRDSLSGDTLHTLQHAASARGAKTKASTNLVRTPSHCHLHCRCHCHSLSLIVVAVVVIIVTFQCSGVVVLQEETENVITELREEIARLRTKLSKNPNNKEDIVKMEVSLSVGMSRHA
jgi:hypothetical protein